MSNRTASKRRKKAGPLDSVRMVDAQGRTVRTASRIVPRALTAAERRDIALALVRACGGAV